ncbi:SIR2 family protein [Paludisphaera mucosa]|uniref:SIR2 family protein n=1 Tax=Paludisphaera mucosa TaxID=3030827 RepID=A0ABT6FA79_9BACT|nr:SIR2 family protein [Paludisphaera mucosa]MDG3004303.1 SIR2 family protein [Paludisphaera mucosa]
MQVTNENTLRKAFAGGINLFLGAGFSVLAKNAEGRALPVGRTLNEELGTLFKVDGVDHLTLAQLCTIIQSERRQELDDYLRRRYRVKSFDPRYSAVQTLNIKNIFTTNIDDLIQSMYAASKTHYLNNITLRGASFNEKRAIDFAPLHGSVTDETRQLTFGTLDLATAFASDQDLWSFFMRSIQLFPTLFWGYSLSDAGVLQALNPSSINMRQHEDKWIVLRTRDDAEIRYFTALGFQILIAETNEMLDYIRGLGLAVHPAASPVSKSTEELFPEEAIPAIGSVPVRPLQEFFFGAPPSWSDIYSQRLQRTSHYAKVVDSINAHRDTIIVGMPASGKTTLLMQAAAHVKFTGHKLVCNSLTPEKVQLLLRRLGPDPALIFVDNYTDSVDAFVALTGAANVVAVGVDRDFNFEVTSHLLPLNDISVINITDLSEPDIQKIFENVPLDIRTSHLNRPKVARGLHPSLYEIIESNITKPSLRKRFAEMLRKLEGSSPNHLDLLGMCCYVHYCRCPVSMETIAAFLRDVLSDYMEAYTWLEQLGTLISEDVGPLLDPPQDYFTPRSSLVSEAIFQQLPPKSLKRVLLKFHRNVSIVKICRYDIFRRKAFDADIAYRAFSNWEEGIEFYELAYKRDGSYFTKQQGALYLSKKKRFPEAFRLIDEAISMSRGRIFSIRNTHAMLLFQANILQDHDDKTVRATLCRSMEILNECHTQDRRKLYHAIVFGKQAVEFHNVYSDDISKSYLELADKWLTEEVRRSPWNYDVRHVHNNVRLLNAN